MAKGDRDGISLRAHKNSNGQIIQYARFVIPEKIKGKIVWRRVERSTRTTSSAKALTIAKALKEEAFKKAFSGEQENAGRTFAEAALSYIKTNGPKAYLTPILKRIGNVSLDDIDTDFIARLAEEMHPGCTPATHNRQAAETKEWRPPTFRRPKGSFPETNWKQPPKNWWKAVTATAKPKLAALILFMRIHGRRISEACAIKPEDVDRETWRVTVRDTKVGQVIQFKLATPVIAQLRRYDWQKLDFIFGYASRWSVYKPLRKACRDAGVPYHVPKDAGRHEFASHLLRSGKTLKEVKEAGRWKSIQMPARISGHLEHNAIDDAARKLGEEWHRDQPKRHLPRHRTRLRKAIDGK
ncbi:MAG: tyrosine-type recombinase/integrase [Rhodomicrobium sp.]|nr:tyrosine-type recombinase/integrase [Rhodomicrobium sp.]